MPSPTPPTPHTSPVAPVYTPAQSRALTWTGRVFSTLIVLFMLADALAKFARPAPVVEGTIKLGYSESVIVPLGVVLLASTLLYIVPATAVLGAILLTGYLGGAVATHVRVSDSLFSHTLFPVYFGIVLWLGLYLRDPRVRAVLPRRG